MGFFNKILTSVGVGGAKVNTELMQSSVRIGEPVQGVVHIYGGNLEQRISRVEVELKTEFIREVNDHKQRHTATLVKLVVGSDIVIQPNEKKQIPFSFRVPEHTPISIRHRNVWVETELEIPMTLDPEDRDYLEIRPSQTMDVVIDAMINVLGFRLREVETNASHIRGSHGFVQEFEFVPQAAFRGRLDEVEISFLPDAQGVGIFMQVDRKARGLGSLLQEAAGLDESHIRFTISNYEASQGSRAVAQLLENTIQRYC